jgi:hypothetical protein
MWVSILEIKILKLRTHTCTHTYVHTYSHFFIAYPHPHLLSRSVWGINTGPEHPSCAAQCAISHLGKWEEIITFCRDRWIVCRESGWEKRPEEQPFAAS